MFKLILLKLFIIKFLFINQYSSISSPIKPYGTYKHSIELQSNVADLWWTVDDAEKEILFEYHVKTTGWIGLGISPAGGMNGADIGVGWIDNHGNVHFQDRFAFNKSKPIIDNTTQDWVALKGQQQSGWTSIQFKRLLDTCDPMDVQIKPGTNIVIFAYGLITPNSSQSNSDITYHETRRGTRMIPLRSYGNPPEDNQFSQLDSFEFRLNNYHLPSTDTTYFCQVFQVPSRFTEKRHIIGYKILIDSSSENIVHHMTTYECDPSVEFNDSNLPGGICDDITNKYSGCMSNVANGWAVGGDYMVEYSQQAGYPIGSDSSTKYFMMQIHFDNADLSSNRYDNSGIRFYVGNKLREHDLGYFTLGAHSSPSAIAIPPDVEEFFVNTYCPQNASQRFPESGITVVSAFPHTHLQGKSVSTKIIRNGRAAEYLFNAESFSFNYQFENLLPKPVRLSRGDTLITQCVYNTKNKNEITLGGQRTKDEMCSHSFTYFPRINNFFFCVSMQSIEAWKTVVGNTTETFDTEKFINWLKNIQWTPELKTKWQQFYDNGPRDIILGGANKIEFDQEYIIPKYDDFKHEPCRRSPPTSKGSSTSILQEKTISVLLLIFLKKIAIY